MNIPLVPLSTFLVELFATHFSAHPSLGELHLVAFALPATLLGLGVVLNIIAGCYAINEYGANDKYTKDRFMFVVFFSTVIFLTFVFGLYFWSLILSSLLCAGCYFFFKGIYKFFSWLAEEEKSTGSCARRTC